MVVKSNGLTKIFDFRFVYLKQERNNRWRDFLRRKDEKIGIAYDVGKRRSQIKRTMKGRGLKTLFAMPLFFAGKNEKTLHGIFKHRKVYKRGVDGGTEFFNLNWIQRMFVRLYLFFVFTLQWKFIYEIVKALL